MVLHGGDKHFIAGLHLRAPESLRHEVDAFRRAAHEDDFARVGGVEEFLDGQPRGLILFGRVLGKKVDAAMDVGVAALVVARDRINHRARFLGRGGVVEIHERIAMNFLVKDRKIGAHTFDVKPAGRGHRALFAIEFSRGGGHAIFLREDSARRNAWSWISFSMCVRTGPSFMRSMHSLANATSSSLRADISSIPRERR